MKRTAEILLETRWHAVNCGWSVSRVDLDADGAVIQRSIAAPRLFPSLDAVDDWVGLTYANSLLPVRLERKDAQQ